MSWHAITVRRRAPQTTPRKPGGNVPDISATFTNNYGESRHYTIWDIGRDPNQPPVIYDGDLDGNQATDLLALHGEGSYGRARYQRSDGAATTVDVTDGSNIDMD
jgi:hypothetical protein